MIFEMIGLRVFFTVTALRQLAIFEAARPRFEAVRPHFDQRGPVHRALPAHTVCWWGTARASVPSGMHTALSLRASLMAMPALLAIALHRIVK